MKKVKQFFNIIKEEKWLNNQLQMGYLCSNISSLGVYTFKNTSKDYVIRLDYQNYMSVEKFEEYKAIYEDFGWKHIRGSRFGSIQYWQKLADGHEDIFSDQESKIYYYKRLMNYSLSLIVMFLIICYMTYKDSSLYSLYNKGLWNMKSSLFWKAFLFETPFVIIKLLPLIMCAFSGISYLKAYRQYFMLKEN
ncbi:DUF2812 domain-containing protein [Clostridium hydrogenum]|uniref:DUF2812 domain-containing protein n=1 Tax=Clostridium hydrogenum TaxID=2855764 RepID=UPI001F391A13|nr:DUF2812 domain-containing protein [Clostridium hydrogenum]